MKRLIGMHTISPSGHDKSLQQSNRTLTASLWQTAKSPKDLVGYGYGKLGVQMEGDR
jgi:hypothetical protein